MNRKIVSALSAAVFLLTAGIQSASLVSCSDASQKTDKTDTIAQTTEETTAEATTEDVAVANIPADAKYDGHEFTILITGNTENNWKKNDFAAEEETGEALNDARYQRNRNIEERFGITIKTKEDYGGTSGKGTGYTDIMKAVMAGDTVYDAAMIAGYDCATLAYSGYLYDLKQFPYLDLTQRWWDQKVNADLTIDGKLYYTTGDISTADNDATGAILFNKKLMSDFDLGDPYQMVRDGTWTIDAMAQMCKSVAADLNGDSKYDDKDRFGAIIWDDTMMGIINACGEKCCTIGEDGKIQLTLYNDRVLSMFNKYAENFFADNISYAYQRTSYDLTTPVSMFSNDQALFFMQLLDLVTYFRDMKTDFGILPFPKLDEAQTEYYETIGSWHSVFLCAPLVQENPERTGIILEAMAAESYNTVTPAYYEKTLVGKYVRDDESSDMLDLILSSRVYDLGWFYQIGGYNEEVMNLWRKDKTDFSSMYQKYEKKALTTIDKINQGFAENTN